MKCLPFLVAGALLVPAALAAPVPPARFRGPDAIERPLDQRLLEDGREALTGDPGEWCPSGPDFVQWLDERGILRSPPARNSTKRHGATPNVTFRQGVVIMEDDGTLTKYDRRPDLENVTLELTPSGDDYTVARLPLAYEADIGNALFTGQRGFAEQNVDIRTLPFTFGGVARTELWVTSAISIAFEDPAAPGPAQLHLGDVTANRLPRVSPFEGGTSLYGWDAYLRRFPARTVITWIGNDGGGIGVDVQAELFLDGRIRFNYRSLRGADHGSVVVVDGDDAWWNELLPGGNVDDPPGDLDILPPDGPAIDVLSVRGSQIGGSELLEVEVELSAPLPADTDGTLQFAFEVRDEPGSDLLNTYWAEWEDGRWNWSNWPVEVNGSTFRFVVSHTQYPLADDDVEIVAWTAQSWNWKEAVGVVLAWSQPPVPLMRDFSAVGPELLRGPIVESFTLPELQIGPVYDAFNRHFDSPRIDGLAVYQSFLTDIVFYAGAWSTVGNAGADGIGAGNTTDPQSPALLHMNTVRYGWNSWDEGKVTVLNHEYGHHWLYFFSIMENGVVGKPLGDGHPAGWTHEPAATPVFNAYDASCMGGSTWTDNGNGTFTSAPSFASFGYSWPDLYLMGLADPVEVGDFFYLRDSDPALPGAYWPPDNTTATATRVDVTFQQIVDAMGPRVPDRPNSRTEFIVPMVLVVRPGELLQDDVDEVERTCAVWAPQFGVATLERGSVTCNRVSLVNRPPTATILDPMPPVRIAAGDTILFTGEGEDPDGDVVELTWIFDGVAPSVTGPGPHAVLFDTPGLYAVQLGARDPGGLTAAWPDFRIIEVTCAEPEEVQDLRVTRDRAAGTISFSWGDPLAWPEEFVVLASDEPTGPFVEELRGFSPTTTPMPGGSLLFFKTAGFNAPDCLGPY
jgi:hypothetical protein